MTPAPIDFDIHSIPARPAKGDRAAEPEHLHLDVRYLALAPADAVEQISDMDRFRRLFEDGGVDPELVAMTGSFVSPADGRALMRGWPDSDWMPLAEFVEEMVGSFETPQTWLLDLDRRFDRLASSMRRAARRAGAARGDQAAGEETTRQLVQISIYGDKQLSFTTPKGVQVARGCQGFEQRITDAETCRSVADFLANLSPDAVARGADLAKMVEEGVYKAHMNFDPEDLRSSVVKDYHALRAFYREVVARGRSVLVTRD
ncbi:hypothetical protein Poly30_35250 [Planctomycetes bacterium Poly30]|uniref:DUF1877 domain-containing protein n=1 Tax=Saltatorellus ferox TaxID=2528018 RepID=A0A518EV65_9BACT|nr:hypothetical protein Poly30_35250 [Planctomycetes bacterium Poly30]